ncbi:hypothetical protein AMTRI_Chr06g169520 [Amborella trichopoda]|uniref:Flowering-promoting factor 1-like protein 3 n=1 Tax=Amborella trichopoda TaxID=13333 RepID=W1PEK2_AMBTC|nr:flowering-promoting factor 1-like protein 1 [Amborella trichopoda]ERN06383.1 hypothetical protein AMTR_s00016p00249730 [Amborella trichopoda]|eukprot:XP_020523045.1 flowering-promoting factor 1-like protein 1 [Amborella trichopoda]
MSGVWVFKNGVARLVSNPAVESIDGSELACTKRRVLVYTPSDEVITSYAFLESKLRGLGWERWYEDPDKIQFHKACSSHLISLPRDFSRFKSVHMFDIVVKNRSSFEVRES